MSSALSSSACSACAISPFEYLETDTETSSELVNKKFYLLNINNFGMTQKEFFVTISLNCDTRYFHCDPMEKRFSIISLLASINYMAKVRGISMIRKYSGSDDISGLPTLHLPFKYNGRVISVIFYQSRVDFNLVTDSGMRVPMVEVYSLTKELPIEVLNQALLLTRKMDCI